MESPRNKVNLNNTNNSSACLRNINDYNISEGDKVNNERLFKFIRKPYMKYNPLLDELNPTEMPLIENHKWPMYSEK